HRHTVPTHGRCCTLTAYILAHRIIPHCETVRIIDVQVRNLESRMDVYVESTERSIPCPDCGTSSSSVHDRYTRSVLDLPTGEYVVHLLVSIRCFKCGNSACPRKYFSEQISNLTVRYQRRTPRAQQRIAAMAVEFTAEGCARLGALLGMPLSADTFLRSVRALNDPPISQPRALGIDDWAVRKGQRYGTIYYNHELHRPIDIIEGRNEEAAVHWMKETRQSPEIVTRDSSMTYKNALDESVPNAKQVADRFHVMQSFSKAVKHCVQELASRSPLTTQPCTDDAFHETEMPSIAESPATIRRRKQWEKIRDLREQGMTISAISRQLNLRRGTVREYLRRGSAPTFTRTTHKVDPFLTYLKERWKSGCHNAKQLFEEIRALGYTGGYSQLAHHVSNWRHGRVELATPSGVCVDDWIRWWLEEPEKLEPENRELLKRWCEQEKSVNKCYELTQRFLQMVHQKQAKELDNWLSEAEHSGISSFRSFVRGLMRDREAVRQALTEPLSNGPTEAAVNSLKALKRQMFGRAKFDLLRKRYLLLSERRQTFRRQIKPREATRKEIEVIC
ncbi:MAG: ISL3 family transposase, partial [Alicyclobacillus sp.]|nr:ISL3 family transposase [Alicyclobacillus sp.]